jgi:hypothetical protein
MTQIISDRKLKDEEEGSEETTETEIKGSGSEKDGNEEGGSKDKKRCGPKREETSTSICGRPSVDVAAAEKYRSVQI